MTYKDIGFSNIRLLSTEKRSIYTYNPIVNTFPDEVFIHEFLHTMERLSDEYGYERPTLHDNEKYGYKDNTKDGLRQWYSDFMCKRIKSQNGTIGLDSNVFKFKPVHNSDFDYSLEVEFENEPKNIIEEIRMMIKIIFNNIEGLQKKSNTEGV